MKENKESSLADFVFDDDDGFNFAATSGNSAEKNKSVDYSKLPPDFDKDEDDDGVGPTNLEKARKEKEVVDGPTPPKKPEKIEKEEEEEDEEGEEEEEEIDEKELEKIKKQKRKKQEDLAEKAGEAADEDFDFGDEPKEKGKDKKGKEKREEADIPENFFTNLALDLKDRGTLSAVEIDENKEYTIEEFFELQETEIESRFNETLDAFREEFDEDGKEFLRWKKNGGSTKEFITQYLAPSFSLTNFDEENQSHIDRTIDFYLKTVEGLEDEDFKERRDYIKDSGKEKSYAKNFFNKLEKVEVERKEVLQKQLELRAKQEQEEEDAFNEEVVQTLKEATGFGSFNISDTDRKGLGGYITKPAVKVGKNRYIPKFQHDLRNILVASTKENKKRLLILAKIVANDFKLVDLEQRLETKVTKGAKARISSSTPQGVTGTSRSRPQLADFIDE